MAKIDQLRKKLHKMGIKTYRNKKTQASFVKKSEVKKVLAGITTAENEIKTDEPIKITYEDSSYGDAEVLIKVDGIDYGIIRHASSDELDMDKIKEWVEETYYDGDYKSDQYSPGTYEAKEFK